MFRNLRFPLARSPKIPRSLHQYQYRYRHSTSTSTIPSAPEHLNTKERNIFSKLSDELKPTRLEVKDVSGGCGSMYAIEIASERFVGLSLVRQHRLVHDVLGEEVKAWHGVQLRTFVA